MQNFKSLAVVSYAEVDAFSKFQNIFPTTSWGGICIKLQIHLLAGDKLLFLVGANFNQNLPERRFTKKRYTHMLGVNTTYA